MKQKELTKTFMMILNWQNPQFILYYFGVVRISALAHFAAAGGDLIASYHW